MKRIVNEFKKNYYEKSITHLCDIRKEIINILDLYSHHLSNLDVIFFVDFLLNESEYPEKTEYKIQIMNNIIKSNDIDIDEINKNFKKKF